MAHRKAGGSTRLGRDSISKRLGVKLFAGEKTKIGSILIRQRGKKFREGKDVKRGGDDTLYAMKEGFVKFTKKRVVKFNGRLEKTIFVSVEEKNPAVKAVAKATVKK